MKAFPGQFCFLSKSMHFQDILKEYKVALEIDKYWTDNELGAFAEAATKISALKQSNTTISEEGGACRGGSIGLGQSKTFGLEQK